MLIDNSLYSKIIDVVPIVCVDGFIIKDDKILLLKRNNYPAINEWWVPGGRVLKNELIQDAIIRKVQDEIGIKPEIVNQIGITETIFEKKHTINICFTLSINSNNIIINSEHSEYNWFTISELPSDLNSELARIIKNKIYDRTNK
jgi:ADP-ribose pyrophosphatase YjhB (NUDIX family)